MSNPFSIQNFNGHIRLCKNGEPIFPMMFFQRLPNKIQLEAFHAAGVELFSFFGSTEHYPDPWWTGENEISTHLLDKNLELFTSVLPDCFAVPRLFMMAPEWWLRKHPEEMIKFGLGDNERTGWEQAWQGRLHESFASKRYLREEGEALRKYLGILLKKPYAKSIAGVQIASGITGEWHAYFPPDEPDVSESMCSYCGVDPATVPARFTDRGIEYMDRFFQATVEAIDHFCSIVKEETDFLTFSFYGYPPDLGSDGSWSLSGDHRKTDAFLNLKSVDIVTAPHSYNRRGKGEDGLYRAYPASLELHGKLCLDECDDRTHLNAPRPGMPFVGFGIQAANMEESIHILRREFGNTLCLPSSGMWYMDLNGGWFDDPLLMNEIKALYNEGKQYMTEAPAASAAEIAIVSNLRGECFLGARDSSANQITGPLYYKTAGELCRTGQPFDWYLSCDLKAIVENPRYRAVVLWDCAYLSADERENVRKIIEQKRTVIFCYGAGSVAPDGKRDLKNLKELTGLDLREEAEQVLASGKIQTPGYFPIEAYSEDRKRVYIGEPDRDCSWWRNLFEQAGVWCYSRTNDVFRICSNALMLHASSDGQKEIVFPSKIKLRKLHDDQIFATDHLQIGDLKKGETVIYFLEK